MKFTIFLSVFLIAVANAFSLEEDRQVLAKCGGLRNSCIDTMMRIQAQQFQMQAIEDKFPRLSVKAKEALNKFNARYSYSFNAMSKFAMEHHPEIIDQVNSNIKKSLPVLSDDEAERMIELVNQETKNGIVNPYMAHLLIFEYMERPLGEFADGMVFKADTAIMAKDKSLGVTFNYPMSWKQIDSSDPREQIVLLSWYGMGTHSVRLQCFPLTADVDKNLTLNGIGESDAKSILQPGFNMLSYSAVTWSGKKAAIFVTDGTYENLGDKFHTRMYCYATVHRGKLVLFSGETLDPNLPKVSEAYWSDYGKYYHFIAQSVRFYDP